MKKFSYSRLLALVIFGVCLSPFTLTAQQVDTLAFQDFETMPQAPVWTYTGTPNTFLSGFTTASQGPPNSPIGIGGSRAWHVRTVSSGNPVTFANQSIPSNYDSIRVRFRLAAMNLNSSSSGGPDHLDYVLVEYSLNNGTNWVNRIRVRGAVNNNCTWPYSAASTAKAYYLPATEQVFQPTTSGLQLQAGLGTVEMVFPGSITQLSIRITPRSSSSSDSWMVDNLVLIGESSCATTTATINPVACESFVSPSGKYVWTSSNTYQDTIPNAGLCDSIITVNLTVNNSSQGLIAETACNAYTSPSGNHIWTTSGFFQDTIPNANGCDSVITVSLTINNGTAETIQESACDAYTSPSGNYTWTTSGTYQDTILNAAGCDSIITVNLTVTNSSLASIQDTVCNTYTSPSGNYVWTATGTYQDTLLNANGCDSLITIDLTVNTNATASINETACGSFTSPSGLYTWTASGMYQDTISTTAGCDSLLTINLTITNADTSVTISGNMLSANVGGAIYQWLDCQNGNQPVAGATQQTFTPSASGSYALRITQDGCTDTSSCRQITLVGLEQNDHADEIVIWPNPVHELLNVDIGTLTPKGQLRIYDLKGRTLIAQDMPGTRRFSLETQSLSAGMYILELVADTGTLRIRFSVE